VGIREVNRAVFLDRDGVLNRALTRDGKPYPPATVDEVEILPGVQQALDRLKAAGYLLVVVTNQPDVARGTTARAAVETINAHLRAALPIDEFRVCYHDDKDQCGCRKPRPGLLTEAAAALDIDLARSWMIGDRWRDIDAGRAAGCRAILIDYRYDERAPSREPEARASSLSAAADVVLVGQISMSERLHRMSAWLARRNDRPLLGFTLGSYYPLHRYPNGVKRLPEGVVRPQDVFVEDYLEDTERLFQMHEAAGGDLVFAAAPFLGMPWVEASLGCGVVADHKTGSTRSTPPAGFAANPKVPKFSDDNPWVEKMLEFIPALEKQSGGRYPVGVTLMRGISDLLSALYGGEGFVLRMHDNPDEVRAVVEQLTEYWIAFGRCLLERLPMFHGGTGSFFYGLWCPGRMIWLQEDAVALLSPRMYEEFIYPADCRIASTFENTVIHLHPARVIPSKLLVKTDLAAIELHIDHDGPRAEALYDHYRTILAEKPLFIWGDLTDADLEFVMTRLPKEGLAVNVVVSSLEEARKRYRLT
jgi:D-glycero-D-manno-heptose 1,7-bisphosphate phosphatase